MRKIVFTFLLFTPFLLSCEKDSSPIIQTVSYEIVTRKSVILTGEVINESDEAVTKRGFCWGTNPNPTLSDSFSENQSGLGVFTESVSNLTYGQEYFFRSYAVDADGTQFGKVLSIKELGPVTGSMTDPRDGRSYATVKINKQTWMAENLAYLPAVSPSSEGSEASSVYYVYGYEGSSMGDAKATANFSSYGVLYNWEAARIACPSGWHLPSDAEWTTLTGFLADSSGSYMKEVGTSHWLYSDPGDTNASGFTVLPGGYRNSHDGFDHLGHYAYFWSSTVNGSFAWGRYLVSNSVDVVRYGSYLRICGFSVRCMQD